MLLQQEQPAATGSTHLANEPRYDADTLRKVTELAQKLQERRQNTYTLSEIEAIGGEIGLQPDSIREALVSLEPPPVASPLAAAATKGVSRRERRQALRRQRESEEPSKLLGALIGAWWAAGWAVPLILRGLSEALHFPEGLGRTLFFLGWFLYIGGGIFVSAMYGSEETKEAATPAAQIDTSELLRVLKDEIRAATPVLGVGQSTGQPTMLSVAPVGLLDGRDGGVTAARLATSQFHEWVLQLAGAFGGELHAAGPHSVECRFPTEAAAARAARALQEGLPLFAERAGELPAPSALRCGLGPTSGDNPAGAAVRLQQGATPGDIRVAPELATGALPHLGGLARVADGREFSWRAGLDGEGR